MKTPLVCLTVLLLITGQVSSQYLTYIDEDYAPNAQLVRYVTNQLRAIRMRQQRYLQSQRQQQGPAPERQGQQQPSPWQQRQQLARPVVNRRRSLLSLLKAYLERVRSAYDLDIDEYFPSVVFV